MGVNLVKRLTRVTFPSDVPHTRAPPDRVRHEAIHERIRPRQGLGRRRAKNPRPPVDQGQSLGAPELLVYFDEDHLGAVAAADLGRGGDQPRALLDVLADTQGVAGCPGHAAAGPHAASKRGGGVEGAVGAVGAEGGLGRGRAEVGEVVAGRQRGALSGRRRGPQDGEPRVQVGPAQGQAELLELVAVQRLAEGGGLAVKVVEHLLGGRGGGAGFCRGGRRRRRRRG